MPKLRILYGAIGVGGAIGIVASFLETIEYQELLKNAHAQLACNLNSVFSCSSVLNAWQSKVFGFPNSMLCTVFFALMFSIGLVGVAGGTVPGKLRLWLHGVALFFLAFASWFMWQSTFRIQALCILCLFCIAGLLAVQWGWLRLNADILPIGERGRAVLANLIRGGADTFCWLLLAILLGFVTFLKFST